MSIGILTLTIQIPGCSSLKEKRSRIKPFLSRLHREFNISVAEIGNNDAWQKSVVACVLISNDPAFTQSALQKIANWIEVNWHDVSIIDQSLELL